MISTLISRYPATKPSLTMSVSSIRFLFILLGPMGRGPQYHEIGRSVGTLMTDEVKIRSREVCDSDGSVWDLFIFLDWFECQPDVIFRFSAGTMHKFTVQQNSTNSQSDGTFLSMKHGSELFYENHAFGD